MRELSEKYSQFGRSCRASDPALPRCCCHWGDWEEGRRRGSGGVGAAVGVVVSEWDVASDWSGDEPERGLEVTGMNNGE